jgi:hypothetical protein
LFKRKNPARTIWLKAVKSPRVNSNGEWTTQRGWREDTRSINRGRIMRVGREKRRISESKERGMRTSTVIESTTMSMAE